MIRWFDCGTYLDEKQFPFRMVMDGSLWRNFVVWQTIKRKIWQTEISINLSQSFPSICSFDYSFITFSLNSFCHLLCHHDLDTVRKVKVTVTKSFWPHTAWHQLMLKPVCLSCLSQWSHFNAICMSQGPDSQTEDKKGMVLLHHHNKSSMALLRPVFFASIFFLASCLELEDLANVKRGSP